MVLPYPLWISAEFSLSGIDVELAVSLSAVSMDLYDLATACPSWLIVTAIQLGVLVWLSRG